MADSVHPRPETAPTALAPTAAAAIIGYDDRSYIDWSSIIGGAFIAATMWLLLTSFGAAVGLAVAPPWEFAESSATLTVATAAWFTIVQLFTMASGGYLAGRMRHRVKNAPSGEIAFRDGVNGLSVWAVVVFATAFAGVAAASIPADDQAAKAPTGRSVDVVIDRLFRPTLAPEGGQADTQTADAPSIAILPRQTRRALDRDEVARLIESEAVASDRQYLAALVASRTNLDQAGAEARVNETLATWQKERKEALEEKRKTIALLGFWTITIVVLSGASAWFAGAIGGRHRDDFV